MKTLKEMKDKMANLFAIMCNFVVNQFDDCNLILKKKNLSEKESICLTIANYLVFSFGITKVSNAILGFDATQNHVVFLFFACIGILTGCYVSYIENKKLDIVPIYQCFKLSLRITLLFKVIMVGICLIAKIPFVGPFILTLFVIIEMPRCIVKELKRLFA